MNEEKEMTTPVASVTADAEQPFGNIITDIITENNDDVNNLDNYFINQHLAFLFVTLFVSCAL